MGLAESTMANALTFDAETHTYRFGGTTLPSVTTILREVGLMDAAWFTPEAAERGTVVHEACQTLNLGKAIDPASIDERLQGHVEAYRRFLADMGPRLIVLQVEQRVFSLQYGFAGTLDIRCTFDGWPTVIDIKTGAFAKWHPLQLSAYVICLPQHHRRIGLLLDPDGVYRMSEYRDASDRDAFIVASQFYRVKRRF